MAGTEMRMVGYEMGKLSEEGGREPFDSRRTGGLLLLCELPKGLYRVGADFSFDVALLVNKVEDSHHSST